MLNVLIAAHSGLRKPLQYERLCRWVVGNGCRTPHGRQPQIQWSDRKGAALGDTNTLLPEQEGVCMTRESHIVHTLRFTILKRKHYC